MKTIITFLAGIFLTASSFAQYRQNQYGQSTVTINFINDRNYNQDFQVVIDGTSYYSNNGLNNGRWNNNNVGNTITLTNLRAGQHSLQVYRTRGNNNYGRNTANQQPLYSSTFLLRQGFDANLLVRENGQVQFTERAANYNNGTNGQWGRDRDGDHDRDDRDRNRGYNNRVPMADYQYNQVLQNVRSKWFQSAKVTAVRNAFTTSTTYFSTYQISQLLQLISNENNRLQLAELSYRVVADPQNFSRVYSLFSNQNNRNELDRYIRSNRY